MIIEHIKKVANAFNVTPNLSAAGQDQKIFGVLQDAQVKAVPVLQSPSVPINEPLLIISCYPDYAVNVHKSNSKPVWLYDRLDSIQDMKLPTPTQNSWIILVAHMDDFVPANMLAASWTDDYEVSVMIADEKRLSEMFTAPSKPVFKEG